MYMRMREIVAATGMLAPSIILACERDCADGYMFRKAFFMTEAEVEKLKAYIDAGLIKKSKVDALATHDKRNEQSKAYIRKRRRQNYRKDRSAMRHDNSAGIDPDYTEDEW